MTEGWNGYYERHFEYMKTTTSTLHLLDLTYSDGVFHLVDINGNGELRHTSWLYMLPLEESFTIVSQNYDRAVHYILSNTSDESVLREQLHTGGYDHFEGELLPSVPYRFVYSNYLYQ